MFEYKQTGVDVQKAGSKQRAGFNAAGSKQPGPAGPSEADFKSGRVAAPTETQTQGTPAMTLKPGTPLAEQLADTRAPLATLSNSTSTTPQATPAALARGPIMEAFARFLNQDRETN